MVISDSVFHKGLHFPCPSHLVTTRSFRLASVVARGTVVAYSEQDWKKAKKLCRLNEEDIRIK